MRSLFSMEIMQTLLLAALFDDSLEDVQNSSDGKTGIYEAALLRDSLFHIGHSGLQLMLTEEIFRIYPEATAGDITFLRTAAADTDVLVYIMLKWNIQNCLFDQSASYLTRCQAAIDTHSHSPLICICTHVYVFIYM